MVYKGFNDINKNLTDLVENINSSGKLYLDQLQFDFIDFVASNIKSIQKLLWIT